MVQFKTYQIKLNLNDKQETTLDSWLNTCRYVYNLALETKIGAWKHGMNLSKFDLMKQVTEIRSVSWISEVPAQTLQNVVERLDLSYKRFYNGAGFPKFKKKGEYQSMLFKQTIKVNLTKGYIQLPKIGAIKYFGSLGNIPKINNTTLFKRADGWYANLLCEIDIFHLPMKNNSIGLDLGIKSFLVSSDGEVINNPNIFNFYKFKLRKLSRCLSRTVKGSNNRKKAANKLAKMHLKITNTRKDFQHKLSTRIIRENQTIVVEDLKVSKMVKTDRLAKSIYDCGWTQFITMLEYKSKWYGREFIKVDPAYTSMDCSNCDYRNLELTLSDREWTCPGCNFAHCRDTNAAINIKNRGLVKACQLKEIYNLNRGVA